MKTTKPVMLAMTIAVALVTVIPDLSRAADDGAAIYKTKCAARHAADAAGKPAAGIPASPTTVFWGEKGRRQRALLTPEDLPGPPPRPPQAATSAAGRAFSWVVRHHSPDGSAPLLPRRVVSGPYGSWTEEVPTRITASAS